MPTVDLSAIEDHIWLENYLLLLGFPTGYVPLRVIRREQFYFMYDPIIEGQLTAPVPQGIGANGISDLGFVKPSLPGSIFLSGHPFNVLAVSKNSHLYQIFIGVAPSATRIFIELPATVGQKNLDVDTWASNKLQFGYFDGFDSPLLHPTPRGEVVIPPTMDIAIGYGNPLPYPISPLLLFVVNRLEVGVVTDPDLVEKMLNSRVPVSIRTIGGLTPYTYNIRQVYGIEGMPLGATRDEVEAGLGELASKRGEVPPPPSMTSVPPAGGTPEFPLAQQARRLIRR